MADAGALVQAPDGPRILFVGIGTFIMMVVLVVAALIIFVGRGLPQPLVAYASAAGLVLLFLLFLLFAPREPAFTDPDERNRLTSSYFVGVAMAGVLAVVMMAGSLAGVILYGCADPINAMVIEDDMSTYG